MSNLKGADIVAGTLARLGVKHLFSLSGNHIMPIYDAALDARLTITHTRHEGAAVHMADAWGRLTGEPGVALLTGGPGHANGVGALFTALASESPLVMLSGHAPLRELGKGSFQEMRQADMAAPVVKASWTAQSTGGLAGDVVRAMRLATSGRPGPVHVSLPFDLLEATAGNAALPETYRASPQLVHDATADALIETLSAARRPLVLVGAAMSGARGDNARARIARGLGVPVVCMESPRGLNDPAAGALAGVVGRADAIVLLGKEPDFTLRFGQPPAIDAACRIGMVDPDAVALERAVRVLGRHRLALAAIGDSVASGERLCERAAGGVPASASWMDEVETALRLRPPEWARLESRPEGPVHPVEVGRAVQALIDAAQDPVFISDGGEFGQWAQAYVRAPLRLINGQGGSIGSAIPFALAARVARPSATVVAMTGDGACGFHLLELETAVRARLPLVIVVGNDACWNAEHQIQLRTYGASRAHSCELAPTRYDTVAAAFGAHGELVTTAADLPAALSRAVASGKPALINVMIERLPAPTIAPTARAPQH